VNFVLRYDSVRIYLTLSLGTRKAERRYAVISATRLSDHSASNSIDILSYSFDLPPSFFILHVFVEVLYIFLTLLYTSSNPSSSKPYPTTPQTRFPESRTLRYPTQSADIPASSSPPSASMMYLSPPPVHDSPQKIIKHILTSYPKSSIGFSSCTYFLPCLNQATIRSNL